MADVSSPSRSRVRRRIRTPNRAGNTRTRVREQSPPGKCFCPTCLEGGFPKGRTMSRRQIGRHLEQVANRFQDEVAQRPELAWPGLTTTGRTTTTKGRRAATVVKCPCVTSRAGANLPTLNSNSTMTVMRAMICLPRAAAPARRTNHPRPSQQLPSTTRTCLKTCRVYDRYVLLGHHQSQLPVPRAGVCFLLIVGAAFGRFVVDRLII